MEKELNKIERKLRKGTATQREINILIESYHALKVTIPADIKRLLI